MGKQREEGFGKIWGPPGEGEVILPLSPRSVFTTDSPTLFGYPAKEIFASGTSAEITCSLEVITVIRRGQCCHARRW